MKRVKLGNSDLEVSIVCLVRWQAARCTSPTAAAALVLPAATCRRSLTLPRCRPCPLRQGTMTWGEQNTEEEAWEQLDYAFSQGVNFLDTGGCLCGLSGCGHV